jgi:dihydropteroate synthase
VEKGKSHWLFSFFSFPVFRLSILFMYWQTSRRRIELDHVLIMAILNVTPDSFSDGGAIGGVDDALRMAEKFVAEGADIIDVGGESTRPGSSRVPVAEEVHRVVPVIEAIAKRFDTPISVDTSKAEVAALAVPAGAEIINDISGLRFDKDIASVAAKHQTGLVLMHSRGDFESMHSQPPVEDILGDVSDTFHAAIAEAKASGVGERNIALDIGIGFGKTREQNLELLAKLDKLTAEFSDYPMLVGTSRKSFIGKLLDGAPVSERLSGSLATASIAVWNGASIIRVHDVKETAETLKVVKALRDQL